jgi:hypothetical protein
MRKLGGGAQERNMDKQRLAHFLPWMSNTVVMSGNISHQITFTCLRLAASSRGGFEKPKTSGVETGDWRLETRDPRSR